jgi:RNA polymerase sigma factor (sigma-70 family)
MLKPTSETELNRVLQALAYDRENESGWRRLVTILWPYVFATNYALLGGVKDLAEDATQDVFLRLMKYGNFKELESGAALRAYLRTICRNTSRTYFKTLSDRLGYSSSGFEKGADLSAEGIMPDDALELSELTASLHENLSESERKVLVLLIQGYDLGEVAQKLAISYSAAGVRVHRLRQKLLASLGRRL